MKLKNYFRHPNLALHIITQDRVESLKRVLLQSVDYFDVTRVCDGGSTDRTKELVKSCSEYYFRKWDDKYHEQDNHLLSQCKPGDWIMILDDDEMPSTPLLNGLRDIIAHAESHNFNMVSLPALDEINGKMAMDVNEFIAKTDSGGLQPFRKLWLFKFDWSVKSYGSPHRSVESLLGWRVYHQSCPYIHFKTSFSYILNDCIHAWINPLRQQYTKGEADDMYDALPKFTESREIFVWLQSDEVTNKFIAFAEKYKHADTPIRNWWAVYQSVRGR